MNSNEKIEIWKQIEGYEGYYEVSSFGRVRSIQRVVEKSNGVFQPRQSRLMTLTPNSDGYLTVKLSKDGKSERLAVHRLVAKAFILNPNNLSDVNHKDFDRSNSCVDNLEWISHKENVGYSIDAGRHFCNRDLHGENNPNYKNDTLKKYYEEHPDEKKLLARPGLQNGMCQAIIMIDPDGRRFEFGYIRDCAKFMIANNICKARNVNAIADRITMSIKKNTTYCNCQFSRM